MFKKVLMGFVCLGLIAMVGCGGGGGGSKATNQNTDVEILIPLPTGGKSMRGSVRAAVTTDTFKAYYMSSGKKVEATQITGLDTETATVAFMNVPPGSDRVIKSEMKNGDDFKLYYQGLVKKEELVGGGNQVRKELTPETTAKAMIFEEKAKTPSNLSVEAFESALTDDVWTYLGIDEDNMKNSIANLSLDTIQNNVEAAAKKIEIVTPTPTPTPTPATITEQGYDEFEKYEETGALTWTPLNSLDAINRIEEGLAEVSESGQFIALNGNIVLTLAAEATVQNNVRTWKVYPYENGARVAYRFIDSISTTKVTALEKQGYHAVYYYKTPNEQGEYTEVGKDFSWFATKTKAENFVSLDVKVTDGVADLQYTTNLGTFQSSRFTTSLAKVNVWYANHNGSVYVKLEDQATKSARILQVASR